MATKKKALETVEEVVVTPEAVAPEAPVEVVEVDVVAPVEESAPVLGVFSLDKEHVKGVAIVRQSVLENGRISVFTADGVGYTFTHEEYNNL